jgi:hypothetical protein
VRFGGAIVGSSLKVVESSRYEMRDKRLSIVISNPKLAQHEVASFNQETGCVPPTSGILAHVPLSHGY